MGQALPPVPAGKAIKNIINDRSDPALGQTDGLDDLLWPILIL